MVFAEFHPVGMSWLLPAQEVICVHSNSDHSDGCDVALPRQSDKSDLGKSNSGPEELLPN